MFTSLFASLIISLVRWGFEGGYLASVDPRGIPGRALLKLIKLVVLFLFPCLFQCDRLTQIQTLMLIAYIVSFGLAGTHYPEGDRLVALGAIGK